MITAMLLDLAAGERLGKARAYAEVNVIPLIELWRIKQGKAPAPGNRSGFGTWLEVGYTVVFALEEQPCGRMRHLSMALHGDLPPVEAVEMILPCFGMPPVADCMVYKEACGEGGRAINLLCPEDGSAMRREGGIR